ncbi:MAG: ribonuclease P protein component [Candidatus Omnitrophica bacterium]|nr:ribonuclease P protein component [Candidatus Omnitrophota bacterium]
MNASAGLKKREKIWRSREFQETYSKGLRIQGPHLILYYIRRRDLPYPRLGLCVAKRSFKLSTQRHLVQRHLREAFRQTKSRFLPGYDIVLNARRFDQKKVGFAQLQGEILDLAKKAGVLKTDRLQ